MGRRNRMWFGMGLAMIGMAPILAVGTAIARIERGTGLLRRWALPTGLFLFLRWLYKLPGERASLNTGMPTDRIGGVASRGETLLEVDRVDDLKVIEGIGPAIESLLQEEGIRTFRQLANMDGESLKSMLREAGIGGISSPHTWPEQALLAADGRFEDLQAYQQTLKAGREG